VTRLVRCCDWARGFVIPLGWVSGKQLKHTNIFIFENYEKRRLDNACRGFNIHMYIYTKIIVWCENEECSIPLRVERKITKTKHTRQTHTVNAHGKHIRQTQTQQLIFALCFY